MYPFIEYIYPMISALYTVIGFSIVGAPIKKNKYRYLMLFIVMYSFTIALSFFIKDYFNSTIEMISGIAGFIVAYSLIFKTKFFKSLSAFSIVYLVGMIAETIFILVLGLFGFEAEYILNSTSIKIFVHFFDLFIMLICVYNKPLNSFLKNISKYSTALIIAVINLMIFILMAREVIDYVANGRTTGLNKMLHFALIILITGGLAIYLYAKNQKEINALKRYAELKEEVTPLIDYSIKQQHDFKNHLLTLKTLFETEESKSIEYINSLTQELKKNNEYLNWCNPILGALIQRKKQEAHQMDIDFITHTNSSDNQFPVVDYELISLISNLLDNAFEATSNLQKNNRKVEMTIGKIDKIFVSVKNTCIIDDVKIENIFKRGYSTKSNSRGLGLHIVKSISNKYNGEIEVFPSNDELEIKVSFDMV